MNRTYWIAVINGGSIAGFGALCLLVSVVWQPSIQAIIVCSFITVAGLMEWIGGRKFRALQPASRWLLLSSQILFFMTIAAYCVYQLNFQDFATTLAAISPEMLNMLAHLYQISHDDLTSLLQVAQRITYVVVIVVSFFYQGGLLIYYALQCKKNDLR